MYYIFTKGAVKYFKLVLVLMLMVFDNTVSVKYYDI